jgi:pyrimidine-nucleoside phosphorylase
MVPADKALYALRDVTATVPSVPLIASSVMSKKIAAGADAIVLDVKYGRGAFMRDPDMAIFLAHEMVHLGEGAGRRTVALVTAMDNPLGRSVGNALEVAEAIATLRGEGPADLELLSLRLAGEMLRLAGAPAQDLRRKLQDGSALRKFAELISAQSGDPAVIDDPARLPSAAVRQSVSASAAGRVSAIDPLEIALAAKSLGAGRDRKDAPIDLSVGIVLAKKVGDAVHAGEALAVIHAATAEAAEKVAARVAAAFSIGEQAAPRPLLLRRVTASGIERLDT